MFHNEVTVQLLDALHMFTPALHTASESTFIPNSEVCARSPFLGVQNKMQFLSPVCEMTICRIRIRIKEVRPGSILGICIFVLWHLALLRLVICLTFIFVSLCAFVLLLILTSVLFCNWFASLMCAPVLSLLNCL